jgi:signal transduction histidine kinase
MPLSPGAREVLESAGEEVDRMARMVENLLTLARLDEGRLELLRSPVDLRELAGRVVSEVEPLARGKRIELSIDGNATRLEADQERLHQAVSNLVDNAIKYTPPGGRVHVSVWTGAGDAGITVSDTGCGIPHESLPRVFDRFFRDDPARSKREGGAGLGLAIAREIAQAHGGQISAESEVGTGSTFRLTLPRGSVPPSPAPEMAGRTGTAR